VLEIEKEVVKLLREYEL